MVTDGVLTHSGASRASAAVHELADLRAGVTRATSLALAGLTAIVSVVSILTAADEVRWGLAVFGGSVTLLHLGVAALPWSRWLRTPVGARRAATHLVVNLAAISLGTVLSTTPSLWLWLFTLTTAHAAATRTPPGQVAAYAATVVAATAATQFTDGVTPSDLTVALATLGGLALLFGLACRRYLGTLDDEAAARVAADVATRRSRTLSEAGRHLSAADPDDVLTAIVDATEQLGYGYSGIYEHDPVARTVRYVAAKGLSPELRRTIFADDVGVAGQVLHSGDTVVMDDYPTHPDANPAFTGILRVAIGTPIRDPAGQVTGVLVCGRDTDDAMTDDDREVFELLASHAGRALSLAEGYRAERRRVAEMAELDRLKSDFLSTVSHELRTPLTVVLGLSETLGTRWHELDEPLKRSLLDRIASNAVALDDVIATLLDFAQLEAGTLRVEPSRFCLTDAVRATLARLEPLTVEHDLRAHLPDAAEVVGDARLLDRVVENLLSNAARHTPSGTRIDVRIESVDGRVHLLVADRGEGITASDLERVGERFFRGGDLNTRTTRGVGLGLALAQEVLELHDSELVVDSVPGEGTTFSFALPCA